MGVNILRKIIGLSLLFLVIIAIVSELPLSAEAQSITVDDSIKVDMKIGFDKFYKLGYSTPFRFEVENNYRDINGELQVEIPREHDSVTVYAINVSLPNNSTKKFVMNIPMNMFLTKLKVNITDGKETVFTKDFRIDPGSNMETYSIGILSDDFDSVRYMNKITMPNAGNFSTKTVKLDEENFPQSAEELRSFNIVVINNYDTSKLNNEQYEAMKNWVLGGGTLILGTGPYYNKTLAVFKDDFINGEIGEVQMLQTSSLYEIAGGNTSEETSVMNISVLDMSIEDSLTVAEENGRPLVQKLEKGKGSVGIAAFDFGLEPLSAWVGNSAFADNLMVKLISSVYFRDMNQKGMPYDNLYLIDNAIRNIPELPLPKTSYMLVIYIAYILISAPISYLVLKKLDRRELMWVTIPVLSIVFSAVIYITGFGTRLTDPITNVISIVEIDNSGTIVPKVYAGVFSPNKQNIRIEAGDGLDLKPMLLNQRYYGYRTMSDEEIPKRIDTKIILSPKTVLEFYKTGIWNMKTLALEPKNVLQGKLEGKLNYANGEFVGTIKNTSGFDLEECHVFTSSQYGDIGPVKNGETKQVKVKAESYFGNRYDLINAIYKDPNSQSQPTNRRKPSTEEIVEFKENRQKRQVFEYALMNQGMQKSGASLVAWSSTPYAKDILVNGDTTRRYEKSLIVSEVELSFRNGNSVEYPFGYVKPVIVNNMKEGNYDDYNEMFYGRGSFEVHYQIDSDISIETVKIQYTTAAKGQNQRIKQYIWSNKSKDWVEGDYSSYTISGDSLEEYLDKSSMLKLKFELSDSDIQLPRISVKGSVK